MSMSILTRVSFVEANKCARLTEVDDARTKVAPRRDELLRPGTLIEALSRVLLYVLGGAVKNEAGVGWAGIGLPGADCVSRRDVLEEH